MKNQRNALATALAVTFTIGLSATAQADRNDAIRYADELESCVTAMREQLDLDGVHRIQHVVTKTDAQGLATALTLETSTFSDAATKQYSAYCVVTGNHRPTRLHVEEKAG